MSVVPQGIAHPAALALGDELAMVLVDDQPDATRPIIFGDPTAGWSGDYKMAVYYYPKVRKYFVLRLCDDGEYRMILQFGNDRPLSPSSVNQAVRRLVQIDSRRGFDAHADVVAHNDRVEAEQVARNDEWVNEEIAPRLAWAYGRDRATHLGGRFDSHAVESVPWHEPQQSEATQPEGA